jgi:hypothetical protein
MNKYLISTIMALSFTGFVTYATIQTTPQKEEQVEVKDEAIQENLDIPKENTVIEQTLSDSIPTTNSYVPVSTQAVVTQSVAPQVLQTNPNDTEAYVSKPKDKLTDNSHYEDDDEDDESEEDDD